MDLQLNRVLIITLLIGISILFWVTVWSDNSFILQAVEGGLDKTVFLGAMKVISTLGISAASTGFILMFGDWSNKKLTGACTHEKCNL